VLAVDGSGQSWRNIELYQLSENKRSFEQQSTLYPDLDRLALAHQTHRDSETFAFETFGPIFSYNRDSNKYHDQRFVKHGRRKVVLISAKPLNIYANSISLEKPIFLGVAGGQPINSTRYYNI